MFRVALLSVVISQATFGMNRMEVVRAHLGQFKDKAVAGLVVAKDFCLNNKNKAITWAQQKPVLNRIVNNPLMTVAFAGTAFMAGVAGQHAYVRYCNKGDDASLLVWGVRWLSNKVDSTQSPNAMRESASAFNKKTFGEETKLTLKENIEATIKAKNDAEGCFNVQATLLDAKTLQLTESEAKLKTAKKDYDNLTEETTKVLFQKDEAVKAALTHQKNHIDAVQNFEKLTFEKNAAEKKISTLEASLKDLQDQYAKAINELSAALQSNLTNTTEINNLTATIETLKAEIVKLKEHEAETLKQLELNSKELKKQDNSDGSKN